MEAANKNRSRGGSKRNLMLQSWQGLGEPAVGKPELRQIQEALVAALGPGGSESPAAIARVLAGAGAELRHPEIIEFDAEWRELQIAREEEKFSSVPDYPDGEPLTFDLAEGLIKSFEGLRQGFQVTNEAPGISRLIEEAVACRDLAESLARNPELSPSIRTAQKEIQEWFKIWLQTPNLFLDWLELRKSSPEFKRRFKQTD